MAGGHRRLDEEGDLLSEFACAAKQWQGSFLHVAATVFLSFLLLLKECISGCLCWAVWRTFGCNARAARKLFFSRLRSSNMNLR